MQHRQFCRNLINAVLKYHLQLHHVVLQLGKRALQKDFSLIHDANMVAYILQLAEVMRADQYRSAALGHIAHH